VFIFISLYLLKQFSNIVALLWFASNDANYSILVETNVVRGIYNFILSTTADEIPDVFLTQRTQVWWQRFLTIWRLHLMLNRRREWIIRGFENILVLSVSQLRSSYAVWMLSLMNPSRRLTYVASIYVIRLTRDLPRYLLVSSLSYSISRQTTFQHLRHAARLLSRAC